MSSNSNFSRVVLDACESALVRRGFRKLRLHSVVHDINKDFLGWVGLNHGREGVAVRINPFVGIHCIPMMRLVAELAGSKYQVGRYATFAVHLGEIDPNFHPFDFSSGTDIAVKADDMADHLCRQAIPFMEKHGNYDTLLPVLTQRLQELGGFPQRVAAGLYLTGRREEALEFVRQRRSEYLTDEDAVRESFDRFSIPFLELVSGQQRAKA